MALTPEILYEDEHILAVDKPAGLVVHRDGRTKEATVTEWLVEKYPEAQGVGEPIETVEGETIDRSGVVHRIDRDTSGVLLLAKTRKGHKVLKRQFQDREVDKVYHFFTYGLVKEDHGSVRLPIGRSKGDFRKWVALSGRSLVKRGLSNREGVREALTYYKVLQRDEAQDVSLVEGKPQTGRTHQIRVHFKSLNNPIVCDKLYAEKLPPKLGFKRLALHARSIKFQNVEGKDISAEAPYPEDFKNALDNIGFNVVD